MDDNNDGPGNRRRKHSRRTGTNAKKSARARARDIEDGDVCQSAQATSSKDDVAREVSAAPSPTASFSSSSSPLCLDASVSDTILPSGAHPKQATGSDADHSPQGAMHCRINQAGLLVPSIATRQQTLHDEGGSGSASASPSYTRRRPKTSDDRSKLRSTAGNTAIRSPKGRGNERSRGARDRSRNSASETSKGMSIGARSSNGSGSSASSAATDLYRKMVLANNRDNASADSTRDVHENASLRSTFSPLSTTLSAPSTSSSPSSSTTAESRTTELSNQADAFSAPCHDCYARYLEPTNNKPYKMGLSALASEHPKQPGGADVDRSERARLRVGAFHEGGRSDHHSRRSHQTSMGTLDSGTHHAVIPAASNSPSTARNTNRSYSGGRLPQAVPINAASIIVSTGLHPQISSADHARIRKQAEKKAQKKLKKEADASASLKDELPRDPPSSDNRRLNSWSVRLALLSLAAGIIAFVIGLRIHLSDSSDSSSSADIPNSDGDNGGEDGRGTETPAPLPTFAPTSSLPTSFHDCTHSNVCGCALDLDESHLGTSLFGSTVDATIDAVNTCDGISRNGVGVWYRLQSSAFTHTNGTRAPTFRRFMASLCDAPDALDGAVPEGTNYDTQISIFAGNRCDRLQCVAGNDQGGVGCADQSRTSFVMNMKESAGDDEETYYIYVHGFRSSRGDFAMGLNELPTNYQCDDAVIVSPSTVMLSSTKGASIQPPEFETCGRATVTAPGVWLQVTLDASPEHDGVYSLIADPITDGFVPQLVVFKGGACDELECVDGRQRYVAVFPDVRTTYHVLVHGIDNSVGDFSFRVVDGYVVSETEQRPGPSICAVSTGLSLGSTASGAIWSLLPEEVDPVASCGNEVLIDTRGRDIFTYRGMWFNTTGTGAVFRAYLCGADMALQHAKVSVLTGSCDDLRCIDASDDGSVLVNGAVAHVDDGACNAVEWYAYKGVEYKIIVHMSEDRGIADASIFTIALEEVGSPINQMCQAAQKISADGTSIIGVLDPAMKTVAETEPAIPIFRGDGIKEDTASSGGDEYLFWYSVMGSGQSLTASTCNPGSTILSEMTAASTAIYIFTGDTIHADSNTNRSSSCDGLRQVTGTTPTASSIAESLLNTPCDDHMSTAWTTEFGQEYFVVVKLVVQGTADGMPDDTIDGDLQQTNLMARIRPTFTLTVEDTLINDSCESAIGPIPLDGKYRTATTRSATRSFLSPGSSGAVVDYPACPSASSTPHANGRDLWFVHVGNGMDLIASTCSIYTQFNTQMTLYRGDECSSLSCDLSHSAEPEVNLSALPSIGVEMNCSDVFLSHNRQFNSVAQSRGKSIRWTPEAGALYFIRISGHALDEDYGVVDFRISPYNDICTRAIPLDLASTEPDTGKASEARQKVPQYTVRVLRWTLLGTLAGYGTRLKVRAG